MWNYFIPFAAGLLQGKDPLQAGTDAAISGTVGNIAGNFGSALDATSAVGPVADPGSYSSLLTNSAGIPVDAATNVATNATTMPSYMDTTGFNITSAPSGFMNAGDKSMMSTLSRQGQPLNSNTFDLGMDANLSDIPESRVDLDVMANQNVGMDRPYTLDTTNSPGGMKYQGADYTPELGQSADYTGGGEDTRPLYKRATDKLVKYFEDKPLEASLTAATLGGVAYEQFKPKQTQISPSPLGPQLGGKQFSGNDSLLKIRRPR
jgi:hypothetical protein